MSEFEKRTQEILEESIARLDGRTRSRLTQARHAALAQKPARHWWRAYVPAGAAAAAVLAVVLLYRPVGPGTEIAQEPNAVEDLEFIADADAPDFVDGEDAEFYEWAAGEIES